MKKTNDIDIYHLLLILMNSAGLKNVKNERNLTFGIQSSVFS